MSDIVTNTNVDPYHDDFDATKGYYRIIFRHSTAVQARELTQLQTALQKQISYFGNHVFKDGSIVSGVSIAHIPNQEFVRVKNQFAGNTARTIASIANTYTIVSANTGVRAVPRLTASGFEAQFPNTNIFYVDYIKTGKDGSNNDVFTFQTGEQLSIYDENQSRLGTLDANNLLDTINVISSNTATGNAYAISISDGVIYQKGFFVYVQPQTALVRKHDTNVDGHVVGFVTEEAIIDEVDDPSLNDNANGSTNYNAPGAHRLKLTPVLTSIARADLADEDSFFPIVEFEGNTAVIERQDSVYSKLGEELARRTSEESGNYVVKPFAVETLANANTDLIDYAVSPGIGYVQGSRVELIGTKKVTVPRSTDTANAESQIITANYGNYVLVKEVAGLFSFDSHDPISIYNAPSNTVTDGESVTASPSGTLIGTATARGFEYDSGVKGSNTAVFRVYLDNITMSNGYSFSRDAKALFANNGTAGYAKGDIVLENNVAVIQDSSLNSLVFRTGINNIRELTDEQFIFRDTVTGTLQANGLVVFTLNSAHAGGAERLNASVGTLGATAELDFSIALSTAAYTTNQTGTVSVSGTTATGVGTSFTTVFEVGDMIRSPSEAEVRKITSIANNVSMTLSSSATWSANTFQKYWPAGHIMNLSGANGSIEVLSNTQFSVSTPTNTLASGTQTVYAQYPVLRASAMPIAKAANKDRYVKINCTANTTGPWDLGLVDIYNISDVFVGTTYAETNPSHPEWFSFDNGQSGTQYGHGKLTIKPAYASKISSSTRLLVKLSHFVANTTPGIGYFSSDSYPFVQSGQSANGTNINIGEVPRFQGMDVRELIDFRPQHHNTANSSTTIGGATENPAANTTYNVSGSGSYLIQPATNFQADVQTYLNRVDMLMLSDTGELSVVQGLPAEYPRTPLASPDGMAIAIINVPAYPSYATREGESYRRSDLTTSIRIITNRRYTMRDIGTIDQRLKTAEYYITLNSLEQSAKDLTIPDANGLDRFKNGIFANPFNTHQLGAVDDFEYKIAIDSDRSIARPYFKSHPIDYTFDANLSPNVAVTGSIVSLNYTSELYVAQPYASKVRNVCESVWNWGGNLSLYPNYDHFRDETKLPAVNVTLDLASAWEDFAASPFGAEYGAWRTSTNVASSAATSVSNTRTTRTTTTTTTTTTTATSSRDVTKLIVDTTEKNYEFGSFVKDVSMNPYMRSREVAFIAYGMKPNTRLHAFFDDVNVDSWCAPATLTGVTNVSEGHENEIARRSAQLGTPLTSNSTGGVCGTFIIPEGQFRTGDRNFRLVNVDSLVTGNDAIITQATARYSADNLSVSTQSISLYTVEPELTVSAQTERKVSVSTQVTTRSTTVSTVQPQSSDPLAQSFLSAVPVNVTGVFIDRIGVYFKSKDSTLGVTCYLMEMNNGVPDTSRVIASAYKPASNVVTSNDATAETVFDFPGLPYCAADRYYAFQIQPDGDSPEYEVWVSDIGQDDVTTGVQIFSNPYVGVLFTSANRNTWTARQEEDLKFNIYRAKFDVGSANAVFKNEADEYFTIDGVTLVNTAIVPQVGDIVYTQNSSGNLVTSNTDPSGYVQLVDDANARIVIDTSNGLFAPNNVIEIHRPYLNNVQTINANTRVGTATIQSIDNIPYSAIVPRFATIAPQYTSIAAFHRGMDTGYGVDTVPYGLVLETENERLDKTRIVASRSNEATFAANTKSSILTYTLTTENDYVSPLIDMTRKSSLVIENIINANNANEHTRLGAALSKYISPKITLADGQDAEDIRVYVTASRPSGTDVEVYVKFKNAEDPEPFNDKVWTKLTLDAPSVFTSSLDPNEYREYMYTLPSSPPVTSAAYANTTSGIIHYSTGTGPEYVGYKEFAIKIVLLANDIHLIPTLNDVRAIALQA